MDNFDYKKYIKEGKLLKEHTVTFSKEEMATLHNDGKLIKKDEEGKDHTYVYSEGEVKLESLNEAIYTDPNTGKSYDLQFVSTKNRWELDVMKKGASIYSSAITTIKRETVEEIIDWLEGYNIDSSWVKKSLKEDRKYNQEELLRLDLIARRKFDCDYEKCTDEQKDEILKDKVKVGVKEMNNLGYKGKEFVFILLNKNNQSVLVKGETDSYKAYLKIVDKMGSGTDPMLYSIDGRKLEGFGGIEPRANQDFDSGSYDDVINEKLKGIDGKACWKGYKLAGTKKKNGKTVDNCVPMEESLNEKEGVPHFTKDGKEWKGKVHKMPDGSLMSGNPHDENGSGPNGKSEKLYHKEDLNEEKVEEAEFKGKDVPLNKPKRGGSKAYYVYVKDPKSKKVKKVSFGSGGLRAKIKNKQARNAFAARHNCKNKKDRTKAGYWSCNLPRYASALGLGANMNTFW